MAILTDTCSLVMIAKSYIPLDNDGTLRQFLQESFKRKELVLLDAIRDEARFVSKGIALERMPFLAEKGLAENTADILPPSPRKFDNMVDNNFCIRSLRKGLSDEEYAQQKAEFVNSGDAKIAIFCLNRVKDQLVGFDDTVVLTEETRNSNDGKLFMKLPLICELIGVKTISAAEYLHDNGFKVDK